MFIVKIYTSAERHTFTACGDSKSACDAVVGLISAFEHRCADWREPVYASILSDNGVNYSSKYIGFTNIVKLGDDIQFPLNASAKKEITT